MVSNLIPLSAILLYQFLVTIIPIVTANASMWNINAAAVAAWLAKVSPFITLWEVYITPNSGKVDRDTMKEALKIARTAMATFARAYLLYNSEVSPAKLAEMGFGPKPKQAPGWREAPILSMVHKIRQVNVRFKGKNAARWGKAVDAHHMEVRGTFSKTRPLSLEDYTFTEEATRTPLILGCSEEQRRTRIWIWTRWVSNSGGKGDWGGRIPVYFS
ncbi:hypothetical protein FACS1894137_07580 [Spirochaetia bacterium]|nr:hypothetical protein FACS1894137_07580 [Spirochaetia bacterium]